MFSSVEFGFAIVDENYILCIFYIDFTFEGTSLHFYLTYVSDLG